MSSLNRELTRPTIDFVNTTQEERERIVEEYINQLIRLYNIRFAGGDLNVQLIRQQIETIRQEMLSNN